MMASGDEFTRFCFWRVPPEQSLLPAGASVEHFVSLGSSSGTVNSAARLGVLLHIQVQVRPDLSSAASWS